MHPHSGLPELPLADAVSECEHICACQNKKAYSYLSMSESSADASSTAQIVNDQFGLTAAKHVN